MNSWFRGYSLVAILLVGLLGVGLSLASVSSAQDAAEVNYALVNTILLISAVLVIFMQAGFALVEVGLNSSKNAVNILAKNPLDFGISVILLFRHWVWVDVSRSRLRWQVFRIRFFTPSLGRRRPATHRRFAISDEGF